MDKQDAETINENMIDTSGRMFALGFLVTRLVADHALRFPHGLCASWLDNIETVVGSMDVTLEPGPVRDSLKMLLRHNLVTAQRAYDLGAASTEER